MRVSFGGVVLLLALTLSVGPAEARDTQYKLKIAEVLNNPAFKPKLGDDVAFYFGNQKSAAVAESYGEWVTNRKTNSAGKADEEACRWAMLSALVELRERAKKLNANAVTNIVSYYKKNTFSSDAEYECHAGAVVAGVALKGTVVKLK